MWMMHITNQQNYSKQPEFWAVDRANFFPNTNKEELQAIRCKIFTLHELLSRYKTRISDEAQEHFCLEVS